MSETISPAGPGWDDESWRLLQRAIDLLEKAWQDTGLPPLAEFLPVPGDDSRHTEMLVRLVEVDRQCRSRAGIPKGIPDYLAEWPELREWGDLSRIMGETADHSVLPFGPGDELLPAAGAQAGAGNPKGLPLQPWALRILCPHCHRAVEIVDENPMAPINCPACSSSFRLIDGGAPIEEAAGLPPRLRRRIAHFELIEQLGVGAFGSVWKAKDMQLDTVVAIKVPRTGQLDPESAERFIREARAAAQLHQSNIVGVHAVGRDGDLLYIVSELIDGIPLDEWKSSRQLSCEDVARLCATIAEALHYAHEKGVIHRDLKPQNILIDDAGEPHLTDFGLAKRESGEMTMTVQGQILGTPAYFSPEQASGRAHEADRRSDIYSLGVILFELLTGDRPFRGSLQMLLKQHVEEEAPSLRKLDAHIPKDLETICLACLEKLPAERYQTAGAVSEELKRFLRHEPILRRPLGRSARAWRWCRRNRVAATLSGALAVSMLIGTVFSAYYAWEARNRAREAEESQAAALQLADENSTLAATERAARQEESRQRVRLLRQRALDSVRLGWNTHDEGDKGGAVVWFADAHAALEQAAELAAADNQPDAATIKEIGQQLKVNRLRLAGVLREFPLTDVWCNVRTACFSNNSRFVATGSQGGRVEVHDIIQHRLVRSWQVQDLAEGSAKGPPGSFPEDRHVVRRVSFSPKDKKLLSITHDGVQVWDLDSGKGRLLQHAAIVRHADFVDEDSRILTASDNQVLWWDLATNAVAHRLGDRGRFVAVSPDGRGLALALESEVHVLKAKSGERVATLKTGPGAIIGSCFSKNARRLAIYRPQDDCWEVWDVAQAARLAVCRPPSKSTSGYNSKLPSGYYPRLLALTPDGSRLAVRRGPSIVQFDVATGNLAGAALEHGPPVFGFAYGSDSSTLAVACGEPSSLTGLAALWDMSPGHERPRPLAPTWFHPRPAVEIQFDTRGRNLLVVGGYEAAGEARLWRLEDLISRPIVLESDQKEFFFSADDEFLVSSGRKAIAWSTATGKTVPTRIVRNIRYTVLKLLYEPQASFLACLNAEGEHVATSGVCTSLGLVAEQQERTLRLPADFRLPKFGCEQLDIPRSAPVHEVTMPPDGYLPISQRAQFSVLLNNAARTEARVWDLLGGQFVTGPLRHQAEVAGALFNSDMSLMLVFTVDGAFRAWDVMTGLPVSAVVRGSHPVTPVALSETGCFLVVKYPNPETPQKERYELWRLFPALEGNGPELLKLAQSISGREIGAARSLAPRQRHYRTGKPPHPQAAPFTPAPPAPAAPMPTIIPSGSTPARP